MSVKKSWQITSEDRKRIKESLVKYILKHLVSLKSQILNNSNLKIADLMSFLHGLAIHLGRMLIICLISGLMFVPLHLCPYFVVKLLT